VDALDGPRRPFGAQPVGCHHHRLVGAPKYPRWRCATP
jgi:hypothetical protein